ncbi:MAG: hypothetical protein HZB25_09875 [Candidatus Eisenbacteria bacterium]|nr:hypothetical protein [Candidatus Eisenbacteria bacterium]
MGQIRADRAAAAGASLVADSIAPVARAWALSLRSTDGYVYPVPREFGLVIQRRISAAAALQVGVAFKSAHNKEEYADSSGIQYWNPIVRGRDNTFDPASWSLSLRYVRFARPRGRSVLHFGAGPVLGYSAEDQARDTRIGPDSVASRDRVRQGYRTLSLGLRAGIGAEVFPVRRASLGATVDAHATWTRIHDWREAVNTPYGRPTTTSTWDVLRHRFSAGTLVTLALTFYL